MNPSPVDRAGSDYDLLPCKVSVHEAKPRRHGRERKQLSAASKLPAQLATKRSASCSSKGRRYARSRVEPGSASRPCATSAGASATTDLPRRLPASKPATKLAGNHASKHHLSGCGEAAQIHTFSEEPLREPFFERVDSSMPNQTERKIERDIP